MFLCAAAMKLHEIIAKTKTVLFGGVETCSFLTILAHSHNLFSLNHLVSDNADSPLYLLFRTLKRSLRLHDNVSLKLIKMVKFWSCMITSRTFFVQYILFCFVLLPSIFDLGSGPEHIFKRCCSLINLGLFCINEDLGALKIEHTCEGLVGFRKSVESFRLF